MKLILRYLVSFLLTFDYKISFKISLISKDIALFLKEKFMLFTPFSREKSHWFTPFSREKCSGM